ncbi:LPS-assembly protein LptD [Seonamhaeicola sediminis]|uniref:LPS-assembly protein LptD n=1 Tax=Seonamhaeicola sediminis TaxID=2528206 RepID=A0A562YFJ6_9FLAO|nr:putative LPS assembly protein LptD [Seonamhaeicola sediminis]TWO33062.1 LPS-assembly protein LptD [Seonamhaeicola sediminis]
MFGFSQDIPKKGKPIKAIEDDSLVVDITDTDIDVPEISEKTQDSIVTDSIKPKELLEFTVKYSATDYTKFNHKNQKLYLFNNARIDYGDMNITAGSITIDYSTNTVYAKGITDTVSGYTQKPVFTQGTNVVEPDSIIFNTDSKKALIYNSVTEQGEGTVIASLTKKENDSVYFIKNAKYTTATDLEDPDYYIRLLKAKIVPGKKIVTGAAGMYIYDVPTPIWLPFSFFPQSEKHTSGILIPTFGEQNDRGYFLQNGGYYFAINDYVDLAVLGDYYTNGSYGLRLESTYAKRYRFRGNLAFRFENLITSERGFPDYAKRTIYNLRWSHSQDSKANPNSRFSASVNLGSSTYFRNSLNQINAGSNFLTNTLNSSVSYSKTFLGEPQVNYSVTATHTQNTQTQSVNMTLPTFQGSIGRMYPFAPKTGTKKGIIKNVNLQYNLRGENRIQTTDSLFFKKEMFDDARAGFQHTVPLTTNFKVFKHFSISAGTNYNEVWTFNTVKKTYDYSTRETITEDINGFDSFRTYNFSTSVGTTVYGMFNFEKEGRDSKLKAIRHVMRPSVSYNINPAFDKYYESTEVINADGLTQGELDAIQSANNLEYSRFEGSIFGSPNRNFSSSMGISIANNLEAKIKNKDTTETEPKKIKLLNSLNFSSSYNFAADSLKWSPVRVNGSTQLFNNQMSINFGATLDPYALDNNNVRIDKFNIDNGGSLFRLTTANLTASWSLSNKDKGKKKNNDNVATDNPEDVLPKNIDYANQQIGKDENDDDENEADVMFYRHKIPWNLRLAYAVNYSNNRRQNEISSHSLMFSGDIDLTSKWSIGASSGYDIKNQGFTYTQLRFSRDLLSWKMDFSWIPFSERTSWNFFIGIKSSILQDLKYEQRRQPDQRL